VAPAGLETTAGRTLETSALDYKWKEATLSDVTFNNNLQDKVYIIEFPIVHRPFNFLGELNIQNRNHNEKMRSF